MENNNSFGNFSNNKNDNKPKKKFNFYWIYVVLVAIFLGSLFLNGPKNAEEIDIQKMNELSAGLERIESQYHGGVVIDADLAALKASLGM